MGNFCPCPRRSKKKQFTYDVHQQTFQMDDNIQNIGETSPKNQPQYPNHDNHILGEEIHTSQHPVNHLPSLPHHLEHNPSEGSQSKKVDYFEAASSHQISAQIKSKNEQQKPPQLIPSVTQKPLHANILKGKTIKKKYNPDDYRFINEVGQFKVKKIDSIKEQQYNIENCKDSQYFIFDITANLYIDDCQNCTIFIAPCQGSIFVRNSKGIRLIGATKQFRTYNCHNCAFSLYCKSQPVIESSQNLAFSSFNCPPYPQLAKQFYKKRLQPWNNHWSQIHNFTKKQGQIHATLHLNIPFQIDWNRAFELAQLQKSDAKNPIPLLIGDLPYEIKNQVLILITKGLKDEKIIQTLQGTVILKGFQGILAGMGKQQNRAILIDSCNQISEKFEQIGKIFTNPSEIEQYKGKWFVSFSDERQK